jgi:magnesium transporter
VQQVNRLELTLSIGNFAAAIGAVVAGIFGMNLRSTIEHSVVGFWGTTAGIILGCLVVCWSLMKYATNRSIL